MIIRWTLRSALHEPATTLASVAGIGAALLIVLLVDGMFAGESERIVAYLRHTPADVWVMQRGVANVHMAASALSDAVIPEIAAVPGVARVTPLLYTSAFLRLGDQQPYSYVVGLPAFGDVGGPWSMVSGSPRPPRGGAIVPDVLTKRGAIHLGDELTLLDRRFTVTGISAGTYSMANSITFVDYEDLASVLSVSRATSYLLVEARRGTSPTELAARIRATVPDVNALPRDELVDRDRRLGLQMGVDVIRVMTWIAALVATLVVAFTVHASTIRRTRELGVVKALGVRPRQLHLATLIHTALLSTSGFVAAVIVAHLARPVIERLLPAVALHYPLSTTAILAAATAGVAVLAAVLPARRVGRIDPALVFRE